MKNKRTSVKALLAGSLIAGSLVGVNALTASNANFEYNNLGSGAELRTALIDDASGLNTFEGKCGGKTDSSKTAKTKDHKCGEGKCGDKKKEAKTKDHKCGEGKCGDKKKK